MVMSSRRGLMIAAAATGLLGEAGRARAAAPGDPGPQNPELTAMNPSMFTPPRTDHGNLGSLKYSFSEAHNKRTGAGWAREVTVRQLPIAKAIAGVDMRLPKGAVRELHWHKPAEWAFMLYGNARITAVDQEGRKFVDDVHEGDLWFFPGGIPHSIQGLEPDGCEFLLAFNDGAFSEDSTFLITEWMAHTPREVLAKNFGFPEPAFDKVPPRELYIFDAPLPGPLADDLAQSKRPEVPESYSFRLTQQTPIKTRGGSVRIADRNNFKASKTMSAALVEVEPGGMRELHWHPLSDEWQFYISGRARMTVFNSEAANTVDFGPSDVGYVPRAMGHYIENTSSDVMRFLEIFADGQYSDVSLSSWMANTPRELVAAHLGIDPALLARIPETKTPVVPV
jgi:oxalate decarboxylase